ncbi:hypothetical protein, partial [Psychrobacillus psychrotolerans]|uniref:hypothetical protein n=1 Tax=Psychrobacillus psychrotolerans TaxID=126156 RepID=UPI003989C044
PPRRIQWEKLELKTPQERSDEEAEAKPTESEVVDLADFNIQLYTPKIEFVYSLKGFTKDLLAFIMHLLKEPVNTFHSIWLVSFNPLVEHYIL